FVIGIHKRNPECNSRALCYCRFCLFLIPVRLTHARKEYAIETFAGWVYVNPVPYPTGSSRFYTIRAVFPLDVEVDTHSILVLNIRKDKNKSTRRD
ncbi:MAG: hypothetical protein U9N62_09025, partial [Thermotogota bacterium]|nr:hypothetical protein [Thermotogota bacterium]